MWVEVVPNGTEEYDLVMHDVGEDIALATCHTDEGDAVILATAFAAYEALAKCRDGLSAARWHLQSCQTYKQVDTHNVDMAAVEIDDLMVAIEEVFEQKNRMEFWLHSGLSCARCT